MQSLVAQKDILSVNASSCARCLQRDYCFGKFNSRGRSFNRQWKVKRGSNSSNSLTKTDVRLKFTPDICLVFWRMQDIDWARLRTGVVLLIQTERPEKRFKNEEIS